MSLIPTWPIAAGTLVLGFMLGVGGAVTVKNAKIERIEARHQSQELARQRTQVELERGERATEQQMVESLTQNLIRANDEKLRIAGERDALAISLQNRPSRVITLPGTTRTITAACVGSTGAELSREDAEFLGGEAARADTIRAELGQCQTDYEALRQLANRTATPAG